MSNLAWVNNKVLDDDEFYNRKEEISNMLALLNLTSTGNAPSLLLTGIRNVGKTVFLNQIKKELDKDYLVVYMDFSRADCYQKNQMKPDAILEFYYKEIIRECQNRQLINLDYRIKKYFKSNDFHIKNYATFKDIPIPLFESEQNFNKLKDFVFNLPNQIYEDYNSSIKGVIIFIDEIQVIKELNDYLESFLWLFRSYTQEHDNVAYVFSGSMSMQDELIPQIASNKGAFGGRMLTIQLNPFDKKTTKNYLNEKADDLMFTKESFARFYKCTGGIPAYINIFGNLLPKNTVLTEEAVIENFDKNISTIINHLIHIWNKLSIKEKDIVVALIDKSLRRVEIADELGVTSGSLSNSLKRLQNLGLIINRNQRYTINEKLLERWLKNEYEIYGSYPYDII